MQNRKALFRLFTANAISGFAQGMSMLSIPWYFAQNSQSQTFNIFYGALTLTALFWGLYAGTLVDRYPRKVVFLSTNILEGSLVGLVALLGLSGLFGGQYYGVLLVFIITMFGYYIHYPNMYAFIQEITDEQNYSKATSYIEIVGQSTTILAGGMVALMLEGFEIKFTESIVWSMQPWSIYQIFLLDAATYFIAFFIIKSIRYVPVKQVQAEIGSLRKRLQSGFTYLKSEPTVLWFGLLSYVVFMALLVELNTLLPMYVKNHLHGGAQVFGFSEMCYALGALFSGLFARKIFRGFTLTAAVIGFLGIAGAAFIGSALTVTSYLFYIWSFLIGLGNAGARIYRLSWIFKKVPNFLIGRVNSIFSMVNVLGRTAFIFLFSTAFFAAGNAVIYAYLILGVFIWSSALLLILGYKRFVSFG